MIKKIVCVIVMLLPIFAILGYTAIEYGFVEAVIALGWVLFLIGTTCIGAYFLVN